MAIELEKVCNENYSFYTEYEKAYDEPQVFVIKDDTLMNKITSLILNNKQIRDITGIEYFVGLKSDLNLSQNYLTNIDPLYNLQTNYQTYVTNYYLARNDLYKYCRNLPLGHAND